MEDRHLFDVYCTATETSRALIRKHRARMRQLIERVLDEGIATGKFEPRDREKGARLHQRCGLPLHQSADGPPRRRRCPRTSWISASRP
jgi:hypothetical protein